MAQRVCFRCKAAKDLTSDNFYREKTRPLGFGYECKACLYERRKGRPRVRERMSQMSPERRAVALERQRRYGRSDKGRAIYLRKAYCKIDACDMTTAEVHALIVQPCTYCRTTEIGRGLDRIDNTKPHVKGNVLPACEPCNKARSHFFTVPEMLRIGALIATIRAERISKGAERVGRPQNVST